MKVKLISRVAIGLTLATALTTAILPQQVTAATSDLKQNTPSLLPPATLDSLKDSSPLAQLFKGDSTVISWWGRKPRPAGTRYT